MAAQVPPLPLGISPRLTRGSHPDRRAIGACDRGSGAAMIPVPSGVRVWLATGATDMRRGMNTLALQVQQDLGRDPHAGDLYVFRGRRGDLIKILPAYPCHSACGALCSQYVLYEGVTVMGFKVASRVRGLSDEAFREAFGTEEQCRAALLRLRWPDGFLCPCCGHREHCVLAGRGALSMQPVQEADIAHGGHDLPRDQAAADTLVRRHPPDRDGEEGHLVNGGGIMHHAERPDGPVAAAQKCANHGPLSVATRGGGCTAWSSMRRFVWRLSTRV